MRVLVEPRAERVREVALSVDGDVVEVLPVGTVDVHVQRVLAEFADVLKNAR